MPRAQIIALLELIEEFVNQNGNWKEKKTQVLHIAKEHGEQYETALEEFTSWFE